MATAHTLAVTAATLTPQTFAPGDTVTARITLRNTGATLKKVQLGIQAEVSSWWMLCVTPVWVTKAIASGSTATVSVTFQVGGDACTWMVARIVRATTALKVTIERAIWKDGADTAGSSTEWTTSTTDYTVPTSAGDVLLDRHIQPALEKYSVQRGTAHQTPADDGTIPLFTIKSALGDTAWLESCYFELAYLSTTYIIEEATQVLHELDCTDKQLNITTTFNRGNAYEFTLSYGDQYERVTATAILPIAFANVHMAGCGKGISFGKFSASTQNNPLFECAYPAEFSENVAIPDGALFDTISVTVPVEIASGGRAGSGVQAVTAPTGFAPVALVGVHTNNANFYPFAFYLASDGAHIGIARYTGTVSSATTLSVTAYVLCQRTSL